MIVIPAIDLKGGQCVRLRQGNYDDTTVFSDNPAEMAKKWADFGIPRLHLVDLDGASSGNPDNFKVIEKICRSVSVPVELGGGIRSIETIKKYLDIGVTYAILGTVAVKSPEIVKEACSIFPDKIIVGIDAKNGFVATNGWLETSETKVNELTKSYEKDGVAEIIYTDISRDGMMQGPNFEAIHETASQTSIPIIASGGFTTIDDVKKIITLEKSGVRGFILGRSIYEETINLKEALSLTQ
ncbi:MAG: 1-(5-phosphoribosyl)-5-[(5-phosphoribosylamino)methylideneamino]imidazole-4-carboxamide isomerase [Nitrospinae bacterium]|nr:1-(5-phosphoribosyl)-5-[(5-phosphoribosylamino)methylideneamino]imidazole-4-carboxamide isomerase [Nitrospinota bacterium]